jgi:dUTP pyrophosphatase
MQNSSILEQIFNSPPGGNDKNATNWSIQEQTLTMKTLPFQKLHPEAKVPSRAYENDAGLDLTTVESGNLKPGEGKIFKTGLAMAIEPGFVGLIWDRSSMGKRGIKTAGGVIDSGYRGEVGVILFNVSATQQTIEAGERIAQLIIQPIATPGTLAVEALPSSDRNQGGFGSSGK